MSTSTHTHTHTHTHTLSLSSHPCHPSLSQKAASSIIDEDLLMSVLLSHTHIRLWPHHATNRNEVHSLIPLLESVRGDKGDLLEISATV